MFFWNSLAFSMIKQKTAYEMTMGDWSSDVCSSDLWYSHLFQNFPQFIVIHTVKGFGIVNKAEIDAFLELSCFFDVPSGCWQFDLWSLCLF